MTRSRSLNARFGRTKATYWAHPPGRKPQGAGSALQVLACLEREYTQEASCGLSAAIPCASNSMLSLWVAWHSRLAALLRQIRVTRGVICDGGGGGGGANFEFSAVGVSAAQKRLWLLAQGGTKALYKRGEDSPTFLAFSAFFHLTKPIGCYILCLIGGCRK